MVTPQLTIIIPVFNAASSIRSLCSIILEQSYVSLELILVDDGSTDKTLNILRGIQSKDKRVKVTSQKNSGPSSARNLGLSKASGQFVMFFDADDTIDGDMISGMVESISKNDSQLSVCGWSVDLIKNNSLIQAHSSVIPTPALITGEQDDIKKYVLRSIGQNGQLYNLWNKIFRLDIIRDNHLKFREDIRFGEDLIFIFHYLHHVRSIHFIAKPYYHYLSNSSTSVFSKSALSPEYRKVNYSELDIFAGRIHDTETNNLLQWIKWRWLLSYGMIVSRSTLSSPEKRSLIQQVASEPIKVAENSVYIGTKKHSIEKLLNTAKKHPRMLLHLSSIASTLRKR